VETSFSRRNTISPVAKLFLFGESKGVECICLLIKVKKAGNVWNLVGDNLSVTNLWLEYYLYLWFNFELNSVANFTTLKHKHIDKRVYQKNREEKLL
jgi:hypothetical protein